MTPGSRDHSDVIEIGRLRAIRDELVAALEMVKALKTSQVPDEVWNAANAAIKKAKEQP
jgi:hypothetical protein